MFSFDRNNIMAALLGLATNSGQWLRVSAKHGFHSNGHVKPPHLSETVELDDLGNPSLQGHFVDHGFGYKHGYCKFFQG